MFLTGLAKHTHEKSAFVQGPKARKYFLYSLIENKSIYNA